MLTYKFKRIIFSFCVFLSLFLSLFSTTSCVILPWQIPGIAYSVRDSQVVFVGDVVEYSFDPRSNDLEVPALISKFKDIKGNVPDRLVVNGFAGRADCVPRVEVGERYIFFLNYISSDRSWHLNSNLLVSSVRLFSSTDFDVAKAEAQGPRVFLSFIRNVKQ